MTAKVLYLSRENVEAVGPPMQEIIATLQEMFTLKGRGETEMPPKPDIHPRPDAFIHAMPAHIPGMQATGIKWVSGYPQNFERGLPCISGLLILNDPETGIPLSVMDCSWITAMRTGAATAVAARHLARPDSVSVGIIACGVQGRSNLQALCCEFGIEKVKAYDLNPAAARIFAEEMGPRLGVEVKVVEGPSAAMRDSDIVVTSGPIVKDRSPAGIEPGWLEEGAFACPLDFDSYWTGAALEEADKLATDDTAQLASFRAHGYFRHTPEPYADLGEIVAGSKPGRESPRERIICMSLGLALSDIATAVRVYRRALEMNIGTELPL